MVVTLRFQSVFAGIAAAALSSAASGAVLVASYGGDVKRFDAASGAYQGVALNPSLPGFVPWGLAADPSDGVVYLSNYNAYSATTNGTSEIASFFLSTAAANVGFDGDGYSNINPLPATITRGGMVSVGPDGDVYMAVRNQSSGAAPFQVVRFNDADGTYIGVFTAYSTGGSDSIPGALAWGPDGRAYMADNQAIRRYNATTGALINTAVPWGASTITFAPDGDLMAAFNTTIRRYDWVGNYANYTTIDTTAVFSTNVQDMKFGPDGNLYVLEYNGDKIHRFNVNTGGYLGVFIDGAPYSGIFSSFTFLPEPSSMAIVALGGAMLLRRRR